MLLCVLFLLSGAYFDTVVSGADYEPVISLVMIITAATARPRGVVASSNSVSACKFEGLVFQSHIDKKKGPVSGKLPSKYANSLPRPSPSNVIDNRRTLTVPSHNFTDQR